MVSGDDTTSVGGAVDGEDYEVSSDEEDEEEEVVNEVDGDDKEMQQYIPRGWDMAVVV